MEAFSLSLDVEMKNTNSPLANDEAWNSIKINDLKNPQNLFNSNEELNQLIAIMSKKS